MRNVRSLGFVIAGAASLALLSSCATPQVVRDAIAKVDNAVAQRDAVVGPLDGNADVRGGRDAADRLAQTQKKPTVLKEASRSWVGSVMVPVNADDRLPATFSSDYVMKFADGKGPLPLSVVTARLSQIVGIPVRISQDVFVIPESSPNTPAAPAAASAAVTASAAAAQPSVRTSTAVSAINPSSLTAATMNWSGSLSGFLDNLTDQLGLSWEYRDGSIVIMRYTTQTYEIATFPNGYNYTINSGASGSTASQGVTATSQLSVSEQGILNGLSSMVAVVKKMVEGVPGSEVLVAEGSGHMVVKTSRDTQSLVREFIRAENANMLRQVQVQLDIYSVRTSDSDELGVDWSAFYRSLSGNFGVDLTSPASLTGINAGSVSAVILPGGTSDSARRFANSTAVINALSQVGDNVQHRPISLVALNRQWARKARLNTTGFLSETKPSVSSGLGGGAGVPGLTTSSITTGDQYAVMPFILENNTVMLKMGVSLSDLLSLFEVTTGSGETLQRVQTPNTSSISDQYTVALRPGEVMAVTGLSRDVSMNDKRTLASGISMLLGGSRAASNTRENFIVFIRAVIL
jgi:type IVB pilus formation R64 PilN family outer membrane protein